jgi:tetrahydromethanopterin S-methyltransferase subunit E
VIRQRLIALSLAAAIAAGGTGAFAVSAASASRPDGDVELAPPKTKPGNNCRKGVSGCTHGKFTGNFFGN